MSDGPEHVFNERAADDFAAATKLLSPYGLAVSAATTDGHDDYRVDAFPLPETAYTHTVHDADMQPCVRTAVLNDDATFTHFHASASGEMQPCVRTSILGHATAKVEILEDGAAQPHALLNTQMLPGGHIGNVELLHFHDNDIIPCIRTAFDHRTAVHDLLGGGATRPRLRTSAEMLDDGALGQVLVTIDDPNIRLTISVGGRTYVLRNGELVLA